ncbi:MAG TPA: hypothetical protein VMC85_20835 [Desulfomonilaceae bacterium]|nr:hypothetical protein [Desulfomonilaceae bacterium]
MERERAIYPGAYYVVSNPYEQRAKIDSIIERIPEVLFERDGDYTRIVGNGWTLFCKGAINA